MRRVFSGQLELRFEPPRHRRAPPGGPVGGRSQGGPAAPGGFNLAAWIAAQPQRASEPGLYDRRRRALLLDIQWPRFLLDRALAVRTQAEAWALWLEACQGSGAARGAWLLELLPGTDTVARADKLLLDGERRGEIVRGAHEPTFSQKALDVGGWDRMTGGRDYRLPSSFTWMPARA